MSENGHVLPRSSSLALLLQELALDQVLLDFAHPERERDPVPPENAIETAQSSAFPGSGSS